MQTSTGGGVAPPRMQNEANANEAKHGAHNVPSLGELVFEIDSVEHELTETLNGMQANSNQTLELELQLFHITTAQQTSLENGRCDACTISAGNTSM